MPEGIKLHGSDSAWDIANNEIEHASDIKAAAPTRHTPLPGADGGLIQSLGGKWIRVTSLALSILADWARGRIIRGGAAAWEAHDAKTAGYIVQGDGTDVKSAAFDWDVFGAGAGADMVHDHSSNAEGGTLSIADEKAKVSANDTTSGYLNGKLIAGTNITLTENDDGGNETLIIAATGDVTLADLHEHTINEDLSGECDSSKTEFILVNEFRPETTAVMLDGARQRIGVGNAYTEGALYDSIVFAVAPTAGQELIVDYEIA